MEASSTQHSLCFMTSALLPHLKILMLLAAFCEDPVIMLDHTTAKSSPTPRVLGIEPGPDHASQIPYLPHTVLNLAMENNIPQVLECGHVGVVGGIILSAFPASLG